MKKENIMNINYYNDMKQLKEAREIKKYILAKIIFIDPTLYNYVWEIDSSYQILKNFKNIYKRCPTDLKEFEDKIWESLERCKNE